MGTTTRSPSDARFTSSSKSATCVAVCGQFPVGSIAQQQLGTADLNRRQSGLVCFSPTKSVPGDVQAGLVRPELAPSENTGRPNYDGEEHIVDDARGVDQR